MSWLDWAELVATIVGAVLLGLLGIVAFLAVAALMIIVPWAIFGLAIGSIAGAVAVAYKMVMGWLAFLFATKAPPVVALVVALA